MNMSEHELCPALLTGERDLGLPAACAACRCLLSGLCGRPR